MSVYNKKAHGLHKEPVLSWNYFSVARKSARARYQRARAEL